MSKSRVIGVGAEASLLLDEHGVVHKVRNKKSYRLPEIDDKITRLRTRAEVRLLQRASKHVPVPKVIQVDEKGRTIKMEFIKGDKLSDVLNDRKDSLSLAEKIGLYVSLLHDAHIIHGDLTTSNMILDGKKLSFIDFGLSFYSEKLEDKAVDIHLFKEALEARHYQDCANLWSAFLKGYSASINHQKVLDQLKKVQARGRHRH